VALSLSTPRVAIRANLSTSASAQTWTREPPLRLNTTTGTRVSLEGTDRGKVEDMIVSMATIHYLIP